MNQSLLDWLNQDSEQTQKGLLLAPINIAQHDNHEELNLIHEINEPVHDEPHETEPEPEIEIQIHEPEPEPEEHEPEPENEPQEPEPQEQEPEHEEPHENASQELKTLIDIPEEAEKDNVITEAEAITKELQSLKDEVDSIHDKTRGLDLNKAWHEASSGLELSMKEPPPQIWASQDENESEDEDSDNDSDSEDYDHIILQQNSSVILHGTNFTQRLQNILQGRKNKAAELRRKNSEDSRHSHPYIRHGFMMCSAVLLALGLAWLSLIYLQTRTPESFSRRASELYDNGKYEEAMNLYQEAYNRYPNVLTFLTGIARSAEKAGHFQTANIAWEEYNNALPKDQKEQSKPEPLKININTGGGKKETKSQNEAVQNTFSEYLNEGNRSFNIGMYNRALINFFHALEQRSDDIRPYIGIAESYRAKGMYFDAKRILDEARVKFGINPSIEAAKEFLKGSK